jgi:hypothetical protein
MASVTSSLPGKVKLRPCSLHKVMRCVLESGIAGGYRVVSDRFNRTYISTY